MTDVQKLKQKSQSNNLEISGGASSIILSRTPNLPINKIINAAVSDTQASAEAIIIKYIVDITLLLLK